VIVVGLAFGGCADTEHAPTIVPYKTNSWSVNDQGSFVETCDASVSDVYCICALGDMMTAYPDPVRLPNPIPAAGVFAAERPRDFRNCTPGSSKGPTDRNDKGLVLPRQPGGT
jgi:hypothetical protein